MLNRLNNGTTEDIALDQTHINQQHLIGFKKKGGEVGSGPERAANCSTEKIS